MIGETGERKSAVATPDGKSRKKKKNYSKRSHRCQLVSDIYEGHPPRVTCISSFCRTQSLAVASRSFCSRLTLRGLRHVDLYPRGCVNTRVAGMYPRLIVSAMYISDPQTYVTSRLYQWSCSSIRCKCLGAVTSYTVPLKEGLYIIKILCRRYPFWSYPAG